MTAGTTAAGLSIRLEDVTKRFGKDIALDGARVDIASGTICGVLGRNGAGKTTMLRLVAAYERATAGRVLIDGDDPYEDAALMSQICLIRDSGNIADDARLKDEMEVCELLRPDWDGDYAARLLDRFELRVDQKFGKMSRGQQSAASIVIGLASRAPLTMFDEPHLGLDAPSRVAFYDELLQDYLEHPRTILISSHLIDEIAPLLEQVVIVDRGRIMLSAPAEDLQSSGFEISGPADLVDAFSVSCEVLTRRTLGSAAAVTVHERLSADRRREAELAGLQVGPLPLQDLFVALTSKESAK